MFWEELSEAFEHALLDSLKTFIIIFIMFVLISFFEKYLSRLLRKQNKYSPLFGAVCGCIPQCGVPLVATDLYMKRHVTMGTLVAIYIACNDEAMPIILADKNVALSIIPLLLIKVAIGFLVGFLIDLVITKFGKQSELEVNEEESVCLSDCCCGQHGKDKRTGFEKHFSDPLSHSLKIFFYILVINFLLHFLIHAIGEARLREFLDANSYVTPLFATIIGSIPNCVSSVIISELYTFGGISFGACLGGLCINSGIGILYLLKDKKYYKDALLIYIILFATSLIVGYTTCLISGF